MLPTATYDIYDYRDPGELRIDAEAEAMVTGHIKTGAVTQDLTAGGELFLRSVQQPGFYTVANPYSSDGIVQDGAVYTYVGSENIYQPIAPFPIGDRSDIAESAGPRRALGRQPSIVRGGAGPHSSSRPHSAASPAAATIRCATTTTRLCTCADFTVPAPASLPSPTSPSGCRSTPSPTTPSKTSLSTRNYGVMLSLGPQAPCWVDNGSQFLAPFFTRQAEVGAKYEPGQRILLTTAFFHMRAPFFYPKIIQAADSFCTQRSIAGDLCFESEGRETHNGIELNAEGKAANWLRLNASAAAMNAHLQRYRHAGLRQQAGDQRAAPAHQRVCRSHCCPTCAACT